MKPKLKRICITPRVAGVGGMVSFEGKFTAGLKARGIQVTYDLQEEDYDAVLVIGGPWKQLVALRRAKRRGLPIVQRLDGMNWLHKRTWSGPRQWLRAEGANWLLAYIRNSIASRIVYQSDFVRTWWQQAYGEGPVNTRVIHNGVDLGRFSPHGPETPPLDRTRILMVEGSLQGEYRLGLSSAVALANRLRETRQVELMIVGRVTEEIKAEWNAKSTAPIAWAGIVANSDIPALNRSAHLLYSSDLNAACPNSVIEALACGLPVLAFDTGALKELVTSQAGRVVPYGGNPWKLDPPDIDALAAGAEQILANHPGLRAGARQRADQAFGLDAMVDAYLEALGG